MCFYIYYIIQPDYHTGRLGRAKLLKKMKLFEKTSNGAQSTGILTMFLVTLRYMAQYYNIKLYDSELKILSNINFRKVDDSHFF